MTQQTKIEFYYCGQLPYFKIHLAEKELRNIKPSLKYIAASHHTPKCLFKVYHISDIQLRRILLSFLTFSEDFMVAVYTSHIQSHKHLFSTVSSLAADGKL